MAGTAAVVLVGGRARRLGGTVKPLLTLGGETLLARIVGALTVARVVPIVAVGPRLDDADVIRVREEPPFGGPVAAVAAAVGSGALDGSAWVLLLAGDLVHPDRLVARLQEETASVADEVQAVVPRAGTQAQWLSGAYRTSALVRALARARVDRDTLDGMSCRALLEGLAVRWIVAEDGSTDDIDTPEDLERARSAHQEAGGMRAIPESRTENRIDSEERA